MKFLHDNDILHHDTKYILSIWEMNANNVTDQRTYYSSKSLDSNIVSVDFGAYIFIALVHHIFSNHSPVAQRADQWSTQQSAERPLIERERATVYVAITYLQ